FRADCIEYPLEKGAHVNVIRVFMDNVYHEEIETPTDEPKKKKKKNPRDEDFVSQIENVLYQETCLHILLSQCQKYCNHVGEETYLNLIRVLMMYGAAPSIARSVKKVQTSTLDMVEQEICKKLDKPTLGAEILRCLQHGWFRREFIRRYPSLVHNYLQVLLDIPALVAMDVPNEIVDVIINCVDLADIYPPAAMPKEPIKTRPFY
ncbi:hypothetical protein RFI_24774, partial [Reticulomyxa filosa]